MTRRVCTIGGCPTLTDGGLCLTHRRERDKARGSRQARGYDRRHERLRARYQARMDRGERFVCWRCAEQGHPHLVDPTAWHLGHDDHDRTRYRGPECIPGNTATAGRTPGG